MWSSADITIRTSVASIREAGRATQGVKLIRIDEGDEIAAISKIQDQEEAVALTDSSIEAQAEAEETINAKDDSLPQVEKQPEHDDAKPDASDSELPDDAPVTNE